MNGNSDLEKRIAWWRDAKFGMFIHWGLYALPAGEWKGKYYDGIGEWIMFKARIPVAEYEALAAEFNPVGFDADAWAQLAQEAGMKYMIITSKHHDGFAMFASEVSKFNIVDATPFRRDPVKELSEACAKRDIKFGVYYSQAQDWHEPGAAIWDVPHEGVARWEEQVWDTQQQGDFDEYLDSKAIPQVKELLSNYGPLGVIWLDTPLDAMTIERAGRLERAIHDLQPEALVSGRIGGEHQADYDSEGDNRIPNAVRPGDWETPATINDTWGFKKHDHNWKQPDDVVFKLVDIVSKGGNYLLNVGPDASGVIPDPSRTVLREVGKWIQKNGDAVYGAGPTPLGDELNVPEGPRYRLTTTGNRIFVHLFEWDDTSIVLKGIRRQASRAHALIDDKMTFQVSNNGDDISIELPAGYAESKLATVICLEL